MDMMLLPPVWRIYWSVLAFAFGAALGSFLHCAAWRTVRGEPFVSGRSRCPSCGATLGARDLVPILSWVALHGRCRRCGAPIGVRYPLTELLSALVTLAIVWRFGIGIPAARNLVFCSCLLFLSLTDLDDCIIPDGCLCVAALAWAIAAPLLGMSWGGALRALGAGLTFGAALLVVSLVMDRVLGRESLGGGDIKLFAVVGLYLGFVGTLFTLILACVLGLLLALALRRRGAFPFGPAIAAASGVMLLFGGGLVERYLALLGGSL